MNEEYKSTLHTTLEDLNEAATGDRHNYFDTWTKPLDLDFETVDDVKKRNLICLFEYYITVIENHATEINNQIEHTTSDELAKLCIEAIEKYDEFFRLDGDNSKVNRWLGYVQGVLITAGLLTVESERNFTRPRLTEHRSKTPRKLPNIFNPPMFANLKNITGFDVHGEPIVTPVDCALVIVKDGDKYLGVSRRDNHDDIGLPGGKRDYNESFEGCAVRETYEETGYTIELVNTEPFYDTDSGHFCVTFLANIINPTPKPVDSAEGIVGFFDKQTFIDGSFGEYNTKMFKHFGY